MAYDEVATDEAVDLIGQLPPWSAYRALDDPWGRWASSPVSPNDPWDRTRHDLADIKDLIRGLIYMQGGYGAIESPPREVRPATVGARVDDIRRRREVRERLENVEWEEVDGG